MKLIFSLMFVIATASIVAQTKTTTSFEVNGSCEMCKTTIEKAAKKAGATKATWNMETHVLDVSFKAKKTDVSKIQQAIATAGYDNVGATATDAAYNALHQCCKYERKAIKATTAIATDLKPCCKQKLANGETACCMPETAKLHACCKKSISEGKAACCAN